mmetsp:Transcript_101545/g.201688  ORF Transcript_101545/g.201688 Transcript_101545/m.201688 type:complete len:158 (+) Transcript_101545:590-1063(+)
MVPESKPQSAGRIREHGGKTGTQATGRPLVGMVGTCNRCFLLLFFRVNGNHGIVHSEEGGPFCTGGQCREAHSRRQNTAIEAKPSTIVVVFIAAASTASSFNTGTLVCSTIFTVSVHFSATFSSCTIPEVEQLNYDAKAGLRRRPVLVSTACSANQL